MENIAEELVAVKNLTVGFKNSGKVWNAISNLDFVLSSGQTLCLVGESGCGKSLTALSLLGLNPPNSFISSGEVIFDGKNLLTLSESQMQKIRGSQCGMIFQEPMTSLNPVLKVGDQVIEPLTWHLKLSRAEALERCENLFTQVGIADAKRRLDDYPHQMSGGMRQRVMIAMALACNPRLLLADEPTTALDVTIQGQIILLLKEQTSKNGMGMIFITHDLGVVAEVADIVGVMYAGQMVEFASVNALFAEPLHPYTKGLMGAAPDIFTPYGAKLATIKGTVPGAGEIIIGCAFARRCEQALKVCHNEVPPNVETSLGYRVRCWLYA